MIELFGVWTPAVVIAAIVAGIGIGYTVVGLISRNPYFSSGQATPLASAALTAAVAAIAGVAFYVGQIVGAVAGGDAEWPRILSRFTLWLVYALFLGVGTYLAAKRDETNRQQRARQRAMRELKK